jgi:choline-sulfatase
MSRPSRPNVLWLFADELRTDALGCHGNPWTTVRTPAIDGLAERGTLFANAFCNSPACVPSRTSLLTATLPDENGVYGNEGAFASFVPPRRFETFPEVFARHGWRTASIGKSHVPAAYAPWAEENPEGGGMHIFGLDRDAARLDPIVPPGIPSPVGGVFPDDEPYPPEAVTRNALTWLEETPRDRPFLLRVSWLQPHTPVLPPARFRRLYDPAAFPGHALPRGHGSAYENLFAEVVGGRSLTDAQMRRAQADYQALVAWLDAQVAQVLGRLDALGLRESTIVVFGSDHGASLGENGLLSKVVFAPQSQRVPLIVAWPGTLPEGVRREDLAQNLDLARTLCALCGVPPAETFGGRDLFADPAPAAVFGFVGSGNPGARASVAAQTGAWRNGGGWPRRGCVRTDRFRLDLNLRQDGAPIDPAEEDIFLADWRADPDERCNLADDPQHAATRDALRDLLMTRRADALEAAPVAFRPDEAPEFAPPTIRW